MRPLRQQWMSGLVRAQDIPGAPAERVRLAMEWVRDARLFGYVLLIQTEPTTSDSAVLDFVERIDAPVIVAGRAPLEGVAASVRHAIDRPGPLEQRRLWRNGLGGAADDFGDLVELASSQFRLSAPEIERASGMLRDVDATTVDILEVIESTGPPEDATR